MSVTKNLRFAINLGNAVLARELPDGSPGGITVQLAHKIAAELGCSAQLKTYPAAGKVVEDAQKDYWDIAFLAVDPQRETILQFTQPYITIQGTVLVHEGSSWQSVEQMDKPGVVINVGKGAAYDLHLTRHLQHATLNRLASSQAAIDAFLQGEGDMAAGIRQPLERTSAAHSGYRVLPDNFGQIHQAICVPRGNEQRYHQLVEMLTRWQVDGAVQGIIDRELAMA
ncbi:MULTISPECIES: ABC transporter substrate-binding protein [unclassified Leclercia]|uniref:ABC transporter substrate-binding protein n=1 Tax=Leclercia barmai TaxID=2785629 RepID=A0ABS7RZK3_9ENTR|nr:MULTISPECIES: ABC transporter substrate-binding protein [unclassified Leclercia]MBZ0059743.1 ABC transporter substrate-binding protein [Leclercia sp. EMC7]MCM5695107.1 ABC transporter substrate-binding protein [Leclercia sp. LTM01]MCM5699516.1 ABC transporter substrate-binding protein [Leclercia sp. LTM14]